jgi:hypothetical protein
MTNEQTQIMNAFLVRIKGIVKGQLSKILKEQFLLIEGLCVCKDYEAVDEMFDLVAENMEEYSITMLLGFMYASDPYKQHFKRRDTLYTKIEPYIKAMFSEQEAEDLLYSLK